MLVYKETTEGSIKFYFDPKNKTRPFSFATSEELWCKFSALQKDSVEQLLNAPLVNNTKLNDFAALPFDEIIGKASDYCKTVLFRHPASCGSNPDNEFSLSKLNCIPARVNFEKVAQSSLKFNGSVDEQKYPPLSSYYNTITDVSDKSNYPVAWKAIAANENDVIRLKVTKKDKDFSISRLVFKNASGTETYKTSLDKSDSTILQIQLSGKSVGSMTEVVAMYTNATGQSYAVGAFNAQLYAPETYTVVLVNTGNASINADAVKEELNRIYGSVFINWEVKVADKLSLPSSIKTNIHIESSGLLSNYMPDMKPIISYFKDNSAAYNSGSTHTSYLLLGCSNDGNLSGYMPRLCNIGFIFENNPHTIAHELGHGAFGLKHIFSADELGEGYRYQTDNVMDYAQTGSTALQNALYKHQWDLIHNPDFVGWFEGDDDDGSEVSTGNITQFEEFLNADKSTLTFVSPAGVPVSLKKADISSIVFYADDAVANTSSNPQLYEFYSDGALRSFKTKDNHTYLANYLADKGNVFAGYYYKKEDGTKVPYVDELSKTVASRQVVIATPCLTDGKIHYIVKKVNYTGTWPSATSNASGTYLKVLPVDYNSVTLTKELQEAVPTTKFSDEALLFLNSNTSCASEYIPYALAVAELMDKHKDVLKDCFKLQWLIYNYSYKAVNCTTCVEKTKIEKYEAAYNSLKNSLETATNTVTDIKQFVAKLKAATSAAEIKQAFAENPWIGICGAEQLPVETRLNALQLILGGENPNEDYWYVENNTFSENKGFIVDYLISKTPQADQLSLISNGIRSNNYQWLRNLWNEYNTLTNDVELEHLGDLFTNITSMLVTTIGKLNVQPQLADIEVYPSLASGPVIKTIRPGLDRAFLIGLKNGKEMGGFTYEFDSDNEKVEFGSDGKIMFDQLYKEDHGYSVTLKKQVEVPVRYNYAYDPLEPVTIKMVDYFYEANNTNGTEITVPAYMAMWYYKSIQKIGNDRLKRKVLDAVILSAGVFAAPFSGGGTLSITAGIIADASTVAAAADLYISHKRETMSAGDYASYKNYFESWDRIKAAVDMANLASGGVQLTVTLASKIKGLKLIGVLNEENSIWKNVSASEMSGSRNAVDMVTKIISNQNVITAVDEAGFSSQLFERSSVKLIPDFDNLSNRIVGHDGTPFTAGIFKLTKQTGSGATDLLEDYGSVVCRPTAPGGGGTLVSEAEAIETMSAFETELAADGLVQKTLQELNIQVAKTQPLTYKNMVTGGASQAASVKAYTLSAASSPASLLLVMTQSAAKPKVLYCGQLVYEKIAQREKTKQQCQVCLQYDQAVCLQFEALEKKVNAGYVSARKNLCAKLTPVHVTPVLSSLNGTDFSNAQVESFLGQLDKVQANEKHLVNKIASINTDVLTAFRQMQRSKASSAGFWADYYALEELSSIQKNATLKQELGGDEGIDAILEKNVRLGCNTCGTSPAPYLNPMDEYLRDVAYFAENFSQVDGYTKALKLLKSDGTGNKVEPEAFILRVLRSDGRKQLQGLEVALEGCEPDVILDDGTVCEFKSWSATVPVDDAEEDDAGGIIGTSLCFDRFAKGQGAYGQFKKILQLAEVPMLSQLNYIFDGRKINAVNKEEYVKKQFQRLLYDASANDGKGGLTAMGEEVWGIISAKQGMRDEIGVRSDKSFAEHLSDIGNKFYEFIHVK